MLRIEGENPFTIDFLFDRLGTSVRLQDYVEVKGYVRAYGFYDDIQKRWTKVQQFIATEVSPAAPEIEKRFGVKGRLPLDTFFHGYFQGQVENKRETGRGWEVLTVRVTGAKDVRDSHIPLSYYTGSRTSIPVDTGDVICAVAEMIVKGDEKRYENLVAREIAIIRKAETDPNSQAPAPARRKRSVSEIVDLYEPGPLEDPYDAAEGLTEPESGRENPESISETNSGDE